MLDKVSNCAPPNQDVVMVAVSYRGFWKSRGKPSQRGLERDGIASIQWVVRQLAHGQYQKTNLIIWGQSIGSGVATSVAASLGESGIASENVYLRGLILETPFTNVREMLRAFYPQRWVPYQYLWPFLTSKWDSLEALRRLSASTDVEHLPRVYILQAGRDEVVPEDHGQRMCKLCQELGYDVRLKVVPYALHTNVLSQKSVLTDICDEMHRMVEERQKYGEF